MNELTVCLRVIGELLSSLSFHHVRMQGEICHLRPRRGLSSEPKYAGTMISDF